MDYRTLLKKYMNLVVYAEGVDFVTGRQNNPEVPMTTNEWEELKVVAAEAAKDYDAA